MRIGLDWDGTVTEDRELWFSFMQLAKARGHDLMIVTSRCEADAQLIREEVAHLAISVIATDGKPKIKEVDAQIGHFLDVWIDDMPHMLFTSSVD